MIKIAFRVLENKLRFFLRRYILRRKVYVSGHTLFSRGCDIVIDKRSQFHAQHKCSVEKGTILAAKHGGTLKFGKGVYINRNCSIVAHESITLEDGVTIGPGCCIYDHDHDIYERGSFKSKPVVIQENAWIGAGSIILKGVTVGRGSVVAAGTVVAKDVPANTVIRTQLAYIYKDTQS